MTRDKDGCYLTFECYLQSRETKGGNEKQPMRLQSHVIKLLREDAVQAVSCELLAFMSQDRRGTEPWGL